MESPTSPSRAIHLKWNESEGTHDIDIQVSNARKRALIYLTGAAATAAYSGSPIGLTIAFVCALGGFGNLVSAHAVNNDRINLTS